MMILAASAAFVGLVHSLAPGHWLPVVLMTKARQWNLRTALVGALVAATGHILLSVVIGLLSIWIGEQLFLEFAEDIERFGGLGLVAFGLSYAAYSYFRHARCHGHTHHGPTPSKKAGPFLFLFTLGLSPCVAVLPVFLAAAPMGTLAVAVTMVAFAVGVAGALMGGTALVSFGVMKLDHPIFEHYGDVITGFGVAVMGLILFFLPHSH